MKFHWWKIIDRGLWFYKYWDLFTEMTYGKPRHPWRENWQAAFFYFQDVGKAWGRRFGWQFYCRTRKQSHVTKNTTRCKTFANFLGTKNELRKVEDIPALELNEYMCEFIISVRTKDGKDYEPSSLRSLLASFERHLKKNSYSASIMNDLVFEKTRKVLMSKQKELKKKGKGNKPNASIIVR